MATTGGPGGASRSTSDAFAPIAASVREPGSRTKEVAPQGVGATAAATSAPRLTAFTSFVIDLLRLAAIPHLPPRGGGYSRIDVNAVKEKRRGDAALRLRGRCGNRAGADAAWRARLPPRTRAS